MTEYDWRPGREGNTLAVVSRGKGGKVKKLTDTPKKSDVSVDVGNLLGWDTFKWLYDKGWLVGQALVDAEKKYGKRKSTEGTAGKPTEAA